MNSSRPIIQTLDLATILNGIRKVTFPSGTVTEKEGGEAVITFPLGVTLPINQSDVIGLVAALLAHTNSIAVNTANIVTNTANIAANAAAIALKPSVNATIGVVPYKDGAASFADSPIKRISGTVIEVPSIQGGANANDDITIQGTSHATRTTSYVNLQPNGGNVGVGTNTPLQHLHVEGNINIPNTTTTIGAIYQNNARLIHTLGLVGNLSIGLNAGAAIVPASSFYNTFLGYGAGQFAGSSTVQSIAIGTNCGGANWNANSGTLIGALISYGANTYGSRDVLIGTLIVRNGTAGENSSICLGYGATVAGTGTVCIGSGQNISIGVAIGIANIISSAAMSVAIGKGNNISHIECIFLGQLGVSDRVSELRYNPGVGTSTRFGLNASSATVPDRKQFALDTSWIVSTDASRTARNIFQVGDYGGLREYLRADATGTAVKIGFFGVAAVARPAAYTPTNITIDRSYDANATTIDELADIVGTMIADFQGLGLLQ